ncbi:MAG: PD-(D/E)XK nuclease family protein, partial [Terracoccus sp.]
ETAVRPLLVILEEALAISRARHSGSAHTMDPVRAADLMLSPIGGADAVGLRRLRRLLRHDELGAGGARSSDELLAELLVEPGRALVMGTPARAAARVAAAIAAGVTAAPIADDGRWAAGVSAEQVLWAVWQGSGVAETWRRTALGGGHSGERADRDLDAVLALFEAAGAFVDRLPQAGPDQFVDHITGQDVPGDTLAPRAQAGAAVELLTPQSAAGRQWRIVVVAGVQEGVWPDLRLRGSVLGSEDLVDVVSGRPRGFRGAQAAVRYDETRLFHVAISRATERLVVTAVGNEDEQPSPYLDLVDPRGDDRAGDSGDTAESVGRAAESAGRGDGRDGGIDDEVRAHTEVGRAMTLTGLVGELRRESVSPDPGVSEPAIGLLAEAARSGVASADPGSWWALRGLTSDHSVRAPDELVRVSPSKVEYFRQCGLRWFLSAVGGEGPSQGAATIGTLVHDIVAEHPDADVAALSAQVDSQWGRLGLRPGWLTDRKRLEAHDMVARYVAYRVSAEGQGWMPVGIETDFRVTVGRAAVSGRVDRIERDGRSRLRIIDLKTGTGKPTRADLEQHGQLGAYQVAIEAGAFEPLGDQSAGAALVQIGKAGLSGLKPSVQQQAPLGQAPDPGWARALVEATADGMGAADFTATAGSWCKTCALKSSCPVQPEGESL